MDVSIYQSPTKRSRIASPATQFIASPVSITKDGSLQWKKSDRSHVQLRYISSEAISEIDASRESPKGFEVCVSPQHSGTNKYIEKRSPSLSRSPSLPRSPSLSRSSPRAQNAADAETQPRAPRTHAYADGDAAQQSARAEHRNAAAYKKYFPLLPRTCTTAHLYKPLPPFHPSRIGRAPVFTARSCRWQANKLIKQALSLPAVPEVCISADDEDTDDEEKNVEYVNEQLEYFQDLLQSSEDFLSVALSYCGATNVEASKIRDEAWAFLESEDKGLRDAGAHTFTQLFYQQKRTPLEKQHLQDKVFPPENDAVFRLTEPTALARMGLKVLALADIEKRLNAPDASPFRLTSAAPTLVRAGVDIVKCFIMLKGNVNESIEFKYGSLSATMGESKPTKSIDLLALGRERTSTEMGTRQPLATAPKG